LACWPLILNKYVNGFSKMKNTRIVFFVFLLILSGQCLVFADSFKGEIYYKFEQ